MKSPDNVPKPTQKDYVFYLNHEIRRSLANLVGISELLKSKTFITSEAKTIQLITQKTLEDIDKVLVKYDHLTTEVGESLTGT